MDDQPPLHPLALEAWSHLQPTDEVLTLSPASEAHFKVAIRDVKRMDLSSVVLSFVTNAEKLHRLKAFGARDQMLEIAHEVCGALSFENEDLRESARVLQDMIRARFAEFHDQEETKHAPVIDAPPPPGTFSARAFIRPLPRPPARSPEVAKAARAFLEKTPPKSR
jgi:hypothetical protein